MPMSDTNVIFKVIETNDAIKVPFVQGQYIIQDDGKLFYDPTTGTTNETGSITTDRKQLTPEHNFFSNVADTSLDETYLALVTAPNKNDMCTISRLIEGTTDKYDHTTYVCSEVVDGTPTWKKITDKYNADNVIVDKNILITADIDGIELTNGVYELPSKGKDIATVLQDIFGPERIPTITQPSASIKSKLNNRYEVGTSITPSFTITFNKGSYSYGPDTGVTVTTCNITDTQGNADNNSSLVTSGNFSSFRVPKNMQYKMTLTLTYSDGVNPNKVPSGTYSAGKIIGKTLTLQSAVTQGYVEGLFYGTSTSVLNEEDITSAIIRGLSKTNAGYSSKNVSFTVPVGAKTIILATPSANTGITKILNTTVNADMTDAFGNSFEVDVAGADGSLSNTQYVSTYDVLLYSPAEAYSVAANLTVTLG